MESMHDLLPRHTHAPSDGVGQLSGAAAAEPVAVVATLSKGYDLDYIWRQVDQRPDEGRSRVLHSRQRERGRATRPVVGPGRQGARLPARPDGRARTVRPAVRRAQAPGGTQLGRPPGSGRKAADLYARLLAAEPHATAERKLAAGRPFLTNTYRINKAVAEMFSASKGIHGSPRITV